MLGKELLVRLDSDTAAEIFTRLYGGEGVETAYQRYSSLIEEYMRDKPDWFPRNEFPEAGGDLRIFTSPGRTELGGNHTDHNQGKVLAASVRLDSVVVAAPRQDKKVFYRSAGHRDVSVDLSDLSVHPDEKGTAASIIRGIAFEFDKRGIHIGGFSANAASQVQPGSGLSSSAKLEMQIAKIFDCFYGKAKMNALEMAQIGQKAENEFFGKPCGLMDQTACAFGGAVAIDFRDRENPKVQQIDFNPAASGISLCVVNTGGSHSDLTADYAAIPHEMKAVAACLGKNVLAELDYETVLENTKQVRKTAGDRALLRAIHFFNENKRVDKMLAAMEEMNNSISDEARLKHLETYMEQVNRSGDSSWELLQNIHTTKNAKEQGISLALALTRDFIETSCRGRGACRVHGGGFAGTIQTYIPTDILPEYEKYMESFFGRGSVTILNIRPVGVAELEF